MYGDKCNVRNVIFSLDSAVLRKALKMLLKPLSALTNTVMSKDQTTYCLSFAKSF